MSPVRIGDKIMTTYQLRQTNGTDDWYVATVDIHPSCASTFTNHGYERLCMWDDMDELATWACLVHDVDPFAGFLQDETTGEIFLPA